MNINKHRILFTILITLVILATSLNANTDNTDENTKIEDHSIGYCLGRGLSNITLGWLEVPGKIAYQSSEIPLFGFFSGAITGVCYTAWRALSGVSDILTFGFGGGEIYLRHMPDFPWNLKWVPKDSEKWGTENKQE